LIDIASGFGWLEKTLGHGEAMIVSFSLINKPQGFGIDGQISLPVMEFVTQSNESIHHEERKATLYKSLNLEESIRTGTRFSRIGRTYTDPCVSIFSQFILREHIEHYENHSH
jgi:hypothetical protein